MNAKSLFPSLIEMLGTEAAQRFLTLAQPELERSQQLLLDSLQQQDWQTAAHIAHKLTATAHLYNSPRLQDALITIHEQNLVALQHPDFTPSLAQTLQKIHDNIQLFITDPN